MARMVEPARREIRFAVVMYGGVSLAIYINGVAQELFKMVRATARKQYATLGRPETSEYLVPDEELKGSEPVYRRLGEELKASFVVDILSGTSAGGINAVFLAKALANDQPMDLLKELWVKEGNIDLLIDREELDASVHFSLATVRGVIMKSAGIVRQLLAFGGKQIISPTILDLNVVVKHIVRMLQPLLGEHIKVIFTSCDGLWPVKIDSTQIDQVMINLALNARDAINESGTLVISTGNVVVDAAFCSVHAEMVPGDYVILQVRDDGCGIERETLDSIFEPYFTTKSMTEGAGLGLATVYGIVQQNRGVIVASSRKGAGTTFDIYLPRSADN